MEDKDGLGVTGEREKQRGKGIVQKKGVSFKSQRSDKTDKEFVLWERTEQKKPKQTRSKDDGRSPGKKVKFLLKKTQAS